MKWVGSKVHTWPQWIHERPGDVPSGTYLLSPLFLDLLNCLPLPVKDGLHTLHYRFHC